MPCIALEAIITVASTQTTIDTYGTRRDGFDIERAAIHQRWNLVANLRLLVFLVLAIALWWTWQDPHGGKWLLVGGLVLALVILIVHHRKLRTARDRLAGLVSVNDTAQARLNLAWEAMPEPPASEVARQHPYAWDLDVVGPHSLLRRLSTPTLRQGWSTLQEWLLAPASAETVTSRQEAIRELAVQVDLRQDVEAAGRQVAGETPDPEPFLAWAESGSWLLGRPWLWLAAILGPLALIALVILNLAGQVSEPWWLVPITINVVLFQVVGRRVSEQVTQATPLHQAISGYAEVFRLIGSASSTAPMLRDIGDVLAKEPDGATHQMKRFARICGFVIPRGSTIWAPLQMALLWDVHVLHALERWRIHAGGQTRDWFRRAGEWEALAALSVLAFDHPEWAFPDVSPAHSGVSAELLTHPLIVFREAVPNDVEVGPRGTFLFVTGSNMSGKSTLLRAIGLNTVLAMAGGPVAAKRMSLPVLDVWTCMRVEDSLARGVSFFMAELQRLKAVVDAASGAASGQVLFLLDEILQGTNTAERQIASRGVLAQLLRSQAIGGVSSHDLSLVEGTDLEAQACAVHFAETFTRDGGVPTMTFDYRLRPGLATSTNALALMELLGFDLDGTPGARTGQ